MEQLYSHDEIAELLGVYAVDAVDAVERTIVEDHLPACPRCKAEVADHREVAAKMAYSGAPAPEGIWSRIQEALEESPPELGLLVPALSSRDRREADAGSTAGSTTSHPAPRRWMPLAAAAALVVLALFAGVVIGGAGDGQAPVDTAAQVTLEDIARRVLNDPDSAKVDLASLSDETLKATAAVEDDGSGYLLGTSLPALDESQTYQLWGVRPDAVISLGILGNSPGVIAFHLDNNIEALVITAEVTGGVPQSSNPAILVGNVV